MPIQPSATGRPRILLVDDEPRILEGLSRVLRKSYQVVTAASGEAALAMIVNDDGFAVIVSDMRMPGIDGAQFLARARTMSPHAIRVLLTGGAEIGAAAAAVNEGEIFRFLQKPCPPPVIEATLASAVAQHRLITAERELLEKTLHGSVEVLTDVLTLVSPVAFARAVRLKRTVTQLAESLGADDRWAIEMAAMFSQLGAITVPPEVLERHYRGDTLAPAERDMIASMPDVATHLIAHVPRLDAVREILRCERLPFDGAGLPHGMPRGEAIPLGARLLMIAIDFDAFESRGERANDALDTMSGRAGYYDPRALAALRLARCGASTPIETREVRLCDVRVGMVFVRDVVATNGLVLIGRGQEATASLVRRIHNFWLDLPLKQLPQVLRRNEKDGVPDE